MDSHSGLSARITVATHCCQALYQIRWLFGNRNWIPPHLVWRGFYLVKRSASQQAAVKHGFKRFVSHRRANPVRPCPAIQVPWRRKAGSTELFRVQAQRVLLWRVLAHGQGPADRLRREFVSKTGLILDFPSRRHILSLSRVQRSLRK